MIYILPRGGFGNVMFNYLIGSSLSKKYNMELYFIQNYQDKRKLMKDYSLFKNCKFVNNLPKNTILIREKEFKFSELPVLDPTKNYFLDGYFQSYKYSHNYLDFVKKFLFPNNIKFENTIMMHIRRGDYLNLPDFHPVQPQTYYKKSLELLGNSKNSKVLVFSDDLNHVKTWGFLKDYNVEFIDRNVEDCFHLMIRCNHFIISNSTLSLLAYYFGKDENTKLCMPKNWFGPKGPAFNLDDLVNINENVFIF